MLKAKSHCSVQRVLSVRALLSILILACISSVPQLNAITVSYDLRGSGAPDGVSSGPMTSGGVTATLTANTGVLNQTLSGYGVNAAVSGDETDLIDEESGVEDNISISFSQNVQLIGLTLSLLSKDEEALLNIAGNPQVSLTDTGSGTDSFSFSTDNLVSTGDTIQISWGSGNGFSFDSFTIETAGSSINDTGGAFSLLALSFLALCSTRRWRRHALRQPL